MSGINQVIVEGNLTKEPELKFLQNGTAVANGSVAYNRSYKNDAGEWVDSPPEFFDFSLFGKKAERAAELKKGAKVIITGALQQRSWESNGSTNYKTSIKADSVKEIVVNRTKQVDDNNNVVQSEAPSFNVVQSEAPSFVNSVSSSSELPFG